MSSWLPSITAGSVDVIFRPSRFIKAQTATYTDRWTGKVVVGARLMGFYVLNLTLYAVPLTLAGFGVAGDIPPPPDAFVATVPAVVGSPTETWELLYGLGQNSVFLTAVSGVLFATFHAGVVFVRQSKGLLQSLHTTAYTSGIYLAGMFTLTVYLDAASTIQVADELWLNFQKRFIQVFIDLSGENLAVPGGAPQAVDTSQLTVEGQIALALMALSGLYLLYSLYLGARINHGMSRADSLLVLVAVLLSPGLYVVGSIVFTLQFA